MNRKSQEDTRRMVKSRHKRTVRVCPNFMTWIKESNYFIYNLLLLPTMTDDCFSFEAD